MLDEVGAGQDRAGVGGRARSWEDGGAGSRRRTSSSSCSGSGTTSARPARRLASDARAPRRGAADRRGASRGRAGALSPESGPGRRLFDHLVTPSGTKIAHEVGDLADFAGSARTSCGRSSRRWPTAHRPPGRGGGGRALRDLPRRPRRGGARVAARSAAERELERHLDGTATTSLTFPSPACAYGGGSRNRRGRRRICRRSAFERRRAVREAQARRLDASAIRLLEEDPELSLLLASESARRAPAPTAEDALRRSLLTSHVRDVFRTGGPITELAFAADGRQDRIRQRGRIGPRRGYVNRGGDCRPHGGFEWGSLLRLGPRSWLVGPRSSARSRQRETPRCSVGRAPVADAVVAGRFVVAVRNGIGAVSDVSSCRLVRSIGRVGQTAVRLVASPDGRRVASLSGREARSRRRADRYACSIGWCIRGEITSLAFSGDAGLVVTGGRDRLARIWSGGERPSYSAVGRP